MWTETCKLMWHVLERAAASNSDRGRSRCKVSDHQCSTLLGQVESGLRWTLTVTDDFLVFFFVSLSCGRTGTSSRRRGNTVGARFAFSPAYVVFLSSLVRPPTTAELPSRPRSIWMPRELLPNEFVRTALFLVFPRRVRCWVADRRPAQTAAVSEWVRDLASILSVS